MSTLSVVVAAAIGLPVGSLCNRLILREPGYVIRDPGDLPDGADPALLDELEPDPDVGDVPVLAVARPGTWRPRWLPVTEVVTAGLFALTALRLGVGSTGLVVGFFAAAVVALAGTDLRVYRLPDRLNLAATAVSLVLIVAASLGVDRPGAIVGALAGGVGYFVLMLLLHLVSPRGMSFGDVKVSFLLGLHLGWMAWPSEPLGRSLLEVTSAVIAGVTVGFGLILVSGGLYGLVRRSFRAVHPAGPSLLGGCLVVLLWWAER